MIPNASPSSQAKRSYTRWIVAGLLLLFTPFVVVGYAVYSVLTLDRDAALLRRQVMNATGHGWKTKVQCSAGWMTLGAARTVLQFVQHKDIADARLALAAVRHASVGVYERGRNGKEVSARVLLQQTDRMMEQRGWSRLVGVVDGRQSVLVYTADRAFGHDRLDLCLAVIDDRDLVIVSTQVDAEALGFLVEKHAPHDLRDKIKLAGL